MPHNGSCGTLIFDGACGFCTWSAEWIRRHDEAGRLSIQPYQTADLGQLSPGLTPQMASQSVYFVRADGRRFHGAWAVFETLRCLPGVWHVLGRVMANPLLSALAEPFYRLVANNRTRISRWLGLTVCAVPPSEQ